MRLSWQLASKMMFCGAQSSFQVTLSEAESAPKNSGWITLKNINGNVLFAQAVR